MDVSGALESVELGVLLLAVSIPLALVALAYAVTLVRAAVAARAVPSLEAVALGAVTNFLDTLGITQRIGDARKMRKDFVPLLGAAEPARVPAKAVKK